MRFVHESQPQRVCFASGAAAAAVPRRRHARPGPRRRTGSHGGGTVRCGRPGECGRRGGRYNLPHAQTHAVLLPYVLAFNGPAMPEAEQRIADALGAVRALDGLRDLYRVLDAPNALRDYGFAESDIPGAAEAILAAVPASNPRPVTTDDLLRLLRAACRGADRATVASEKGKRAN